MNKTKDIDVAPEHDINGKRPKHLAARMFWGIFFLAATAIVLLQGFGVIALAVNVWIIVALIAMAAVAIAFLTKFFWIGAFMVIASGIVVACSTGLLPALTGEQVGMTFAAAGLLAVAFHIFLPRAFGKGAMIYVGRDGENYVDVSFTSTTKYMKDEAFTEALLDCSFGNIKAYFDDVKLKGKTARIKIDTSFGNTELYLPKNWAVDNQMEMSFGGVEEKNHPSITPESPKITLVGDVSFGAVTITYV